MTDLFSLSIDKLLHCNVIVGFSLGLKEGNDVRLFCTFIFLLILRVCITVLFNIFQSSWCHPFDKDSRLLRIADLANTQRDILLPFNFGVLPPAHSYLQSVVLRTSKSYVTDSQKPVY